jgi:hypothetical protein
MNEGTLLTRTHRLLFSHCRLQYVVYEDLDNDIDISVLRAYSKQATSYLKSSSNILAHQWGINLETVLNFFYTELKISGFLLQYFRSFFFFYQCGLGTGAGWNEEPCGEL